MATDKKPEIRPSRKLVSVHFDTHKRLDYIAWKKRVTIMSIVEEGLKLYEEKHKNDPDLK